MKIEISGDDLDLSLSITPKDNKELYTAEVMANIAFDIIYNHYGMVEEYEEEQVQALNNNKNFKAARHNLKVVKPNNDNDNSVIRERLPNVIDISKLNPKNAETKNILTRCPVCGQSHVIVVNSNEGVFYMSKRGNPGKEEYVIISEPLPFDEFTKYARKDDESLEKYYYTMQNALECEGKDFVITNDNEVFCPVCHESNPLSMWKKAYYEPSTFFEYDHPCEVCGGETVLVNSNKEDDLYKCERCGHEQIITQ